MKGIISFLFSFIYAAVVLLSFSITFRNCFFIFSIHFYYVFILNGSMYIVQESIYLLLLHFAVLTYSHFLFCSLLLSLRVVTHSTLELLYLLFFVTRIDRCQIFVSLVFIIQHENGFIKFILFILILLRNFLFFWIFLLCICSFIICYVFWNLQLTD